MIKVIYIIPRLNNAGPVNHLFGLVEQICNNCSVKILTLYPEKEDSLWKNFLDLNIEIESLNIKTKRDLLFVGRVLTNKLSTEKPHIVHSETFPADFAVSLAKCNGMLWYSTIHCNIYNDYSLRFRRGLSLLMIKLHELCINKMDNWICCSESIKKVYERKYKKELVVIQNGVDINQFKMLDKDERESIRTKLNIPVNKKIIVIVGSLDERKNSLFIIYSLRDWLAQLNIQIIFLGTGPLENECKKVAKGYDIVFKGQVKDVKQYLQCADVYMSASKSEGLPLSVLEAGACGLPMVLSDIPAHREFSMYGNLKGISYFNVDNETSLLNILKGTDFSEEAIKVEVSEYFQLHFSTQKMASKYFEFYMKNTEV